MYIMSISHCRPVDMFCNIDLHFALYRLLKPSGVFHTYFGLSKPGLGRGRVYFLALIYGNTDCTRKTTYSNRKFDIIDPNKWLI